MDAGLKARWVEALRSGGYEQTHGALRLPINEGDEVGYCCLGVLCNLIDPDGWDHDYDGWQYPGGYDDDGDIGLVAMGDIPWLLLGDDEAAGVAIGGFLARVNDGTKDERNPDGLSCNFNEIADLIELSPDL